MKQAQLHRGTRGRVAERGELGGGGLDAADADGGGEAGTALVHAGQARGGRRRGVVGVGRGAGAVDERAWGFAGGRWRRGWKVGERKGREEARVLRWIQRLELFARISNTGS